MTPEQCAAAVAPAIDRVVIWIHIRSQPGGRALAAARGLDRIGSLVELRSALPAGPVARTTIEAVARYMPDGSLDEELAVQVAQGMLSIDAATGAVALTGAGADLVDALYDLHGLMTAEAWAGHDERVARLCGLSARLLDAARPTAGAAFAGLGRPYERAGDPATLVLFNRLAALRYHRADAHAAAWAAAGHDARSIDRLAPGLERDAIEADTNRRAAPPYATLAVAERSAFTTELAGLPI